MVNVFNNLKTHNCQVYNIERKSLKVYCVCYSTDSLSELHVQNQLYYKINVSVNK